MLNELLLKTQSEIFCYRVNQFLFKKADKKYVHRKGKQATDDCRTR